MVPVAATADHRLATVSGSDVSPSSVQDFSGKTFGLLIAYVIPGFVALCGVAFLSPIVAAWLRPSPDIPAGIESVFFVTVASIAAGMTTSAFRWALLDVLHEYTGLARPTWDDRKLQERLAAFDTIVEAHYQFYLFHANTAVATGFAFAAWCLSAQPTYSALWPPALVFTATELVFIAAARDTLRKYYVRTSRLLGLQRQKGGVTMTNGNHPPKSKPAKPATGTKQTSSGK